MWIDLHLHSSYSDGTWDVRKIIDAAAAKGLKAISITDHDNLTSCSCLDYAAQRLECIPGIEMSCDSRHGEVHILGYGINPSEKRLLELVSTLQRHRRERIMTMIKKLRETGVDVDAGQLPSDPVVSLGRLHVARLMVCAGAVKNTAEAFRKYIGDGCPAAVPRYRLEPAEAIKAIKGAGGVSSLAHPVYIRNDSIIPELKECGLDAVEAYHSEHGAALVDHYLGLARKYGLLITGGSDFHGDNAQSAEIGNIRAPYGLVHELRARLCA